VIDISLKNNPEMYFDYRKGLEFLKGVKDEDFSYPDEITLFHLYTEFRNPKELLSLTSYLATQNLEKTKLIIWSDYDISDQENIQPYKDLACLEFRVYNFYEEIKGTILEGNEQIAGVEEDLGEFGLEIKSDLLRVLAGYKYGGIWIDMDLVLLRDFKPILGQEYMYQWGSETEFSVEGACATVLSLNKGSEFASELLNELVATPPLRWRSTAWGKDMYATLWKRYPKFTIFPSTFFNTEWLMSKVDQPLSVEVEKSWFFDVLIDRDNLFLDAFSWHWHNSSNKAKDFVKGSKFDLLNKRMDTLVYEKLGV
jgi:hypothetical protein